MSPAESISEALIESVTARLRADATHWRRAALCQLMVVGYWRERERDLDTRGAMGSIVDGVHAAQMAYYVGEALGTYWRLMENAEECEHSVAECRRQIRDLRTASRRAA